MKIVEQHSGTPPASVPARTIELDHDQSLAVGAEWRTRIKVIYGFVWVSDTSRSNDCLVGSEETVVRVRHGSILRSIGRTRIEIVEVARSRHLLQLREKIRRWLHPSAYPRAPDQSGA